MLTTFEGDVEIQRALEAAARGYLLKNMPPNELVQVIRQVHAGKKRVPPELAAQLAEHMSDDNLTMREVEVLQQIAGGSRNRDIAEMLYISEETVKVHVKHIMDKPAAKDRTQAIAIAVRIQRAVFGTALLAEGGLHISGANLTPLALFFGVLTCAAGVLLLIGFLTPIVAIVVAAFAAGVGLSWLPPQTPTLFDSRLSFIFAFAMLVTIVGLGPGAFSLDARLFGRREILIPPRTPKSGDRMSTFDKIH